MIHGPQSNARAVHSGHEIRVFRTGRKVTAATITRLADRYELANGYTDESTTARRLAMDLKSWLDNEVKEISAITTGSLQ
jgi:hypothetical protein